MVHEPSLGRSIRRWVPLVNRIVLRVERTGWQRDPHLALFDSLAIAAKTPNNDKDGSGEIEAETRRSDDVRPIEKLTIHGDGASFATTSACARRLLATGLVKLDVGGTKLDDAGLAAIVTWTPWLREISASGLRA